METLAFDDDGFGVGELRIPWGDLVALGVRTTADGPWLDDVFWQFTLPGGTLEFPGSMLVDLAPLSSHLPGFGSEKVIKAMGSCEVRYFRVWHRDESPNRPDEEALRARFSALVERLGGWATGDEHFTRLYAAWSAKSRHYHDVEHLTDCLRELDGAVCARPHVVELALWYHDAVYEPGKTDCEERSAAWLLADAAALGIHPRLAEEAAALVRATAHGTHGKAATDEAALIADVDFAILGRDALRFLEFEYGVGDEYEAIPAVAFLRGRGRFLARLLQAPIYRTASFRERYEEKARANIAALLASPRYRTYRWLRWLPA